MITRHPTKLADDKALGVGNIRFHVVDRHAVVADMRIGHGDDLPVITRVSQDFLVACHGGVENDFTDGFAWITESVTVVNCSVLEGQKCGGFFEQRHICKSVAC